MRRWRQCFVEEHYMPTLLAWLGKDGETDCMGHLSDGDWTRPGSHGWSGPYEYFPADISADLCALLLPRVALATEPSAQPPSACK